MPTPATPSLPFVAWTDEQAWAGSNANAALRHSTAHHLHQAFAQISPFVGQPAIEGVIVYDTLQRGAAVLSLLNTQGRSLPSSVQGDVCDGMFDEDALCEATNAHRVFANMHEGSRGMLVTLSQDPSRRMLLLPQREAILLSPLGRRAQEPTPIATLGLLAHEMGHARDYADGRPARPSLEEIEAVCAPGHAQTLHAVADMALAEYVATRAECKAQEALFGASSFTLAKRVQTMGGATLTSLNLNDTTEGMTQTAYDRQTLGYHLGTLAAYAQSPVVHADGTPSPSSTADMVRTATPRGSALGALIKTTAPCLEAAVRDPSPATRQAFITTLEQGLQAPLERTVARRQKPNAR